MSASAICRQVTMQGIAKPLTFGYSKLLLKAPFQKAIQRSRLD